MNWDKFLEMKIEQKRLEEIVTKGPIKVPSTSDDLKKPESIVAIVANPIYAGVPPYPAIVKEDLWIKAFCKSAENYGLPLMLKIMLDSLRQTYNDSQ
jgi:hypothetical protein